MQKPMHSEEEQFLPGGVFLNEEEQGGGPLIDIGTHALDLTLWMMDNYEVESATGQTFHKLADQTNQGNAFWRLGSGRNSV